MCRGTGRGVGGGPASHETVGYVELTEWSRLVGDRKWFEGVVA